jgi:hypothetical protein
VSFLEQIVDALQANDRSARFRAMEEVVLDFKNRGYAQTDICQLLLKAFRNAQHCGKEEIEDELGDFIDACCEPSRTERFWPTRADEPFRRWWDKLTGSEVLWQRLVEAYTATVSSGYSFKRAKDEFLAKAVGVEELIRSAFATRQSMECRVAVRLLQELPAIDTRQFLTDLIAIYGFREDQSAVKDVIAAMPRQWLVENIEAATEPLLQQNSKNFNWAGMLSLYTELDVAMAERLAAIGIASSNVEARRICEEFLQRHR